MNNMDKYFMDMKDTIDLLDEMRVLLPKEVVTFYTQKDLSIEFYVKKQMIFNKMKLAFYKELGARLLEEKNFQKVGLIIGV